jgi:hypothetical protein
MADAMGDHASPNTCLTDNEHGSNIFDNHLHYFGCLREADRERFLDGLKPYARKRILEEKAYIARLRSIFEKKDETESGHSVQTENGRLLQDFQSSLSEWQKYRYKDSQPLRPRTAENGPLLGNPSLADSAGEDFLDTLNAAVIFFKDSEPHDHPDFDDKFPNQKVSIRTLLDKKNEKNPLMTKCPSDMIRYFHFPANNMGWIEVNTMHSCSAYSDN